MRQKQRKVEQKRLASCSKEIIRRLEDEDQAIGSSPVRAGDSGFVVAIHYENREVGGTREFASEA